MNRISVPDHDCLLLGGGLVPTSPHPSAFQLFFLYRYFYFFWGAELLCLHRPAVVGNIESGAGGGEKQLRGPSFGSVILLKNRCGGWSVTKHGFVLTWWYLYRYYQLTCRHAPPWTSGSALFQYQTSSCNTNNDKNHRFCSGELACSRTQKLENP